MSEHADLLFTGGPVFGVSRDHREPSAVAVRRGRIVAVGADAHQAAGPGTETVDLAGGLLVPGFTDAHVHAVQGGLERLHCDLTAATSREDCLRAVREYADTHPDAAWVTGGGWDQALFPGGTPTARDLDTVVADRPVFLPNASHHGAWVNSRALALAGVDAATPDPPDGRVERDHDGAPTGTLHEGAMNLVARLAPGATAEEYADALLVAQEYLHSLGITGWQDAILGRYANIDDVGPVYLQAAQRGTLTARVVGALWWERDRGAEQIPELLQRRATLRAGRFRATSVKIMQDGVPENGSAGMLEPYFDRCGCRTANRGHSYVDPVQLRRHVAALDAEGFQVHVHAIGDRAVRESLDAFEAARAANGRNDHRHHIAHLQVVHPDDVARFGRLGVTANIQPLWATYEPQMVDLTIPFIGDERAGWQYPFGGFARSGATLAAGSDWPVSSPDPLAGIHVAVNRRTPRSVGVPEDRAFLPEQALDLETALTAYTRGSAHVNHLDDGGRIAVGALADLAVLDRNPFAAPPEEIGDTRVVATYVHGEQVFCR
ncbi:MAG TPA: amidohydrolase [Nocardioidaceae bacterium]|nr:amidohydrolase [Nocardioidaceae bacterium]